MILREFWVYRVPRTTTIHRLRDWSRVSEKVENLISTNSLNYRNGDMESLGIHFHNGALWTGPYVGVRQLRGHARHRQDNGSGDQVIVIEPRFGLSPWEMLSEVFRDEEFGNYLEASEASTEPLFKVFSYEKPVRVPLETAENGEMLLYLSFVASCFSVCRKGLKKTMAKERGNLTAKIRGKINVAQNLKRNTLRGRNDRFFCEFPIFTTNNIENRALKTVLRECSRALRGHVLNSPEIKKMIRFCFDALRHVSDLPITSREIGGLSATGLYSYYKPAVHQASFILGKQFGSPKFADLVSDQTFGVTLPYLINMQLVFELYCRKKIKDILPASLIMDQYQDGLDVRDQGQNVADLHINKLLKPDIVLRNYKSDQVVMVLDAKYKQSAVVNRSDTLQMLAYAFNTAPLSCGFLFPKNGQVDEEVQQQITLRTPFVSGGVPYSEAFITHTFEWATILSQQPNIGAPDYSIASEGTTVSESAGNFQAN